MPDQLLVNIIRVPSVGTLAPGAIVTLPHGLKYAGNGVVPNQYLPWTATNIIVNVATTTDVTFQNIDPNPQFAFFRIEYDHSIHAVDTGPLYWRGVTGSAGAAIPAVYGEFSDSTDQTFVAGSALAVKYDTDEGSNGVSVTTDPGTGRASRLTVGSSGVYSFSISPQILHTGGGSEIITFWARLNGTNVPRSASSLEMGNNNNRTLPFMEIILPMSAGQYVEWLFYSSGGTNLSLEAFPAVVGPPAIPAIPSVIANVKRLGS